jgi:hypothetical protein
MSALLCYAGYLFSPINHVSGYTDLQALAIRKSYLGVHEANTPSTAVLALHSKFESRASRSIVNHKPVKIDDYVNRQS